MDINKQILHISSDMVTRKKGNRNTNTDKRAFEVGEVQLLKMTGKYIYKKKMYKRRKLSRRFPLRSTSDYISSYRSKNWTTPTGVLFAIVSGGWTSSLPLWENNTGLGRLKKRWCEEYIYIYMYIHKVKWSRYRPGVVQRVGRGVALLFHDLGTRR